MKSRHPIPGGGGVHGLEYAKGTLWNQIPVHLGRAHGLAWVEPDSIWCMHSTDRVIHRLDAKDGRVLEVVTLSPEDPDPHGIAPGGKSNESASAGYVCRIDLA